MKWRNKGREFDNYADLLTKKRDVFIYGAGKRGRTIHDILDHCNRWLQWNASFADRDAGKRASGYCGRPVVDPGALYSRNPETSLIIVCLPNPVEVLRLLGKFAEAGFVFMRDVFVCEPFIEKYLPIHLVCQYNVVFIPSLNIVPTTVCNLNCQACLNFNPYIKKHTTYDMPSLRRSVDDFFAAVDAIHRFQVTGGEPMLFPGTGELLAYVDGKYRDRIIELELVTNGTIVPSEDLCRLLARHNVFVYLDDYRCTVDQARENFPKIVELFDRFNVRHVQNRYDLWFDLSPDTTDNSHMSEEELAAYYDGCDCPYTTLVNSSLTSCNYAHYAAKAGICPDSPDNYFDLRLVTPENKKELVEFRLRYNARGYHDFCKQCLGFAYDRPPDKIIPTAVQLPRNTEK